MVCLRTVLHQITRKFVCFPPLSLLPLKTASLSRPPQEAALSFHLRALLRQAAWMAACLALDWLDGDPRRRIPATERARQAAKRDTPPPPVAPNTGGSFAV